MPASNRLNLQGQTLVIAAAENSPHVLKNFLGQSDITNFGYEMIILHELSVRFNFTIQLIDTLTDTGKLYPNGTWSGLIGLLAEDKADIGFGGLTITNDREKVVDFLTPPHFSSAITFITTLPKTTESITMFAIDPYIFLFLFISVILIFIAIKFIANYHDQLKNYSLYWMIFAIAVRQDVDCKIIKQDSIRILIYTWQWAALVITLLLGGFIYKSFSSPKRLITIDTLYELSEAMKSNSINVLINKNSARYTELEQSKRGIIQDIYLGLKGLEKGQKGVQSVRDSKVALAYIDYRSKFEYELYKKGQNIYHIPPDDPDSVFRNAFFAFAVNKKFKYIDQFRKYVKNMVITGFIIHWIRKQKHTEGFVYHEDMTQSDKDSQGDEEELGTIAKTLSYVAGIGLSVSILVFLIELTYNTAKSNKISKRLNTKEPFMDKSDKFQYLSRYSIHHLEKINLVYQ